MRICDWSSDVCSSDLDGRRFGVDLAQTVDGAAAIVELQHLAIAIGDTGSRKALRRAPALRAADIVAKVLALLFVEQALYPAGQLVDFTVGEREDSCAGEVDAIDRKSTRLNSSH